MRRRATFALLAVAALVLAALAWSGRPGRNTVRPNVTPEARAAQQTGARPAETSALPTRDLFRFGDGQNAGARPAQTPALSPAAEATVTTAPPPRVRLIGFVRTQRHLKAVVALEGTVNVLGSGEEAGGFRILELDQDAGRARLRTPEGDEIEAALAPR